MDRGRSIGRRRGDRDIAHRSRHASLDRLEADGSLVGAAHLREPGFGKIVRVEGRRVWQPAR